ncbi:MAG: hypothetical protein GX036_04005 [Firmicutes bacterium]|nr:hypothetical protein [Bacillota bacterium]
MRRDLSRQGEKDLLLLLQTLNILAFAIMVALNLAAVLLPLNGQTTGEVARSYPSLFIPAGFAFTIWWVIYLLLAGFIIYQAQGLFRGKPARPGLVARTGWFFLLSSLANSGWILFWHHHRIGAALITNLILWVSLAFIYRRLVADGGETGPDPWFITRLPFSIYLAWITISLVGNLSVYLVKINWNGWGLSQTFWTVLALFCLAAVAGLFFWFYQDRAFILTFAWAFFGVFYQRFFMGDSSVEGASAVGGELLAGGSPPYHVIGLVAVAMAFFCLALFLADLFLGPGGRRARARGGNPVS